MRDVTLIVTHAELTPRHGVGSLLLKIFNDVPNTLVLYSHRFFGGESGGDLAAHLENPHDDSELARSVVAEVIEPHEIVRIICVPHYMDEVRTAIAAAELSGAPLVTYVMDDRNLMVDEISDQAMRALIERSAARFAISPTLCDGFEAKFGTCFSMLPPVNDERLFAPAEPHPPLNEPPRGCLIGNLWSEPVISSLRNVVAEAGVELDWFGNAGRPFVGLDPEELRLDGIALHGHLPEEDLAPLLRSYDYGIMPTTPRNQVLDLDWLFRGSLPSRLVFMITAAHLPLIVLGDPLTAAASFVTSFGLGAVVDYDAEAFGRTVEWISKPATQLQLRTRASRLAPSFAAAPVAEWIWRSASAEGPIDGRYESLFDRKHDRLP